jgi:hypothetical protein
MATRMVLATTRCADRLHACVSSKRWEEMEARQNLTSIRQGHYVGQEKDLLKELSTLGDEGTLL